MKENVKNQALILIIVLLSVFAFGQFSRVQDLKYNLVAYKSIPHIELSNVQFESSGVYRLYISGFAAFNDISNQPKDLRQYYIIEPLFKLGTNNEQLYSLQEVIALYPASPRKLGDDDVILRVHAESRDALVLKDDIGNSFFINKLNKEVTMQDVNGDDIRLITSDKEYRDFMRQLLRDGN